MTPRSHLVLAVAFTVAVPWGASAQRAGPCRTACAFEVRLAGDGCCPARAVPRRATPPCGALDHPDGAHCCPPGASWSAATARCACAVSAGCGPARCAAAPEVACDARVPLERPRFTASLRLRERLPRREPGPAARDEALRSREQQAQGLSPDARAAALAGLVEDCAEAVAQRAEAAPGGAAARLDPALAGREHRERIVRAVQVVVETAPTAPTMDALLFRLGAALLGLSRDEGAQRAWRALFQRFPESPFAAHASVSLGDRALEARDWETAALFYEAALRRAEPASEIRAYARYRLAWVRLAQGAAAAARGLFEEAAAEGESHPDSPELARLAAAARADRAVATWIADPNVATDPEALPAAAALVDATGDWRGSIALHRRLLAARSLDDRFCAWRAAAARALRCIDRPASAGPREPLPPARR